MGSMTNRTDHAVTEVAAIYNRATYLPEMREAIAKWEGFLASQRENA
jgi:hypothetical protein